MFLQLSYQSINTESGLGTLDQKILGVTGRVIF